MPPRASNTLSAHDHAAVFAYILKANGYSAGTSPLTAGSQQLTLAHLEVAGITRAPPRPAPPAFISGAADAAPANGGPDQLTLSAAAHSSDWLIQGHDYSGTRFSPLRAINATNAALLAPACMFQIGERDNFQTGPIVFNGTMYVTTMTATIALDAATCRTKWRHSWEPRDTGGAARNRGVALKEGRVVRGTPDGYLIALNSDTAPYSGRAMWRGSPTARRSRWPP